MLSSDGWMQSVVDHHHRVWLSCASCRIPNLRQIFGVSWTFWNLFHDIYDTIHEMYPGYILETFTELFHLWFGKREKTYKGISKIAEKNEKHNICIRVQTLLDCQWPGEFDIRNCPEAYTEDHQNKEKMIRNMMNGT